MSLFGKITDFLHRFVEGTLRNTQSKFCTFAVLFGEIVLVGDIFIKAFLNRTELFNDRFRYGYVVDMFEFKPFHFAIFNVADICVTFAFIFVLVYMVFIDPKIEKAKKAAKLEAEKTESKNE